MNKLYLSGFAAIVIWLGLAGIAFAESERVPARPNQGSPPMALEIHSGNSLSSDSSIRSDDMMPGSWNTNLNVSLSLAPPSNVRANQNGAFGIFSNKLPDGIRTDGSMLFNTRPSLGAPDSDAPNSTNQWSFLLSQIAAEERGRLSNGVLTIGSVPEPGTLALLSIGCAGFLVASIRRRR